MKNLFSRSIVLIVLNYASFNFQIQAQDLVRFSEIEPRETPRPITDLKIHEDDQIYALMVWAAPGFEKKRSREIREHIYVVSGRAEIKFENSSLEVKAGDWVLIPKMAPHTIKVLSEENLKLFVVQDKRSGD